MQHDPSSAGLASSDGRALGTGLRIVMTRPQRLVAARAVDRVLVDIDAVCSRFREDSELIMLNGASGREQTVSPLLAPAIGAGRNADTVVRVAGWPDPAVQPGG